MVASEASASSRATWGIGRPFVLLAPLYGGWCKPRRIELG
jgi:hypothetical protein